MGDDNWRQRSNRENTGRAQEKTAKVQNKRGPWIQGRGSGERKIRKGHKEEEKKEERRVEWTAVGVKRVNYGVEGLIMGLKG